MTAAAVEARRGRYDPQAIIQGHGELREVMTLLESGHFNQFEPGLFDPIIQAIRNPHDPWMTAGDFPDYVRAQESAATAYREMRRMQHRARLDEESTAFPEDMLQSQGDAGRALWREVFGAPW